VSHHITGGATSLLDRAGSSFLRKDEEIMLAILLFTAVITAVLLAARSGPFGGDAASKALAYRHKENGMLIAVGFNPQEGGDLWTRDGVTFGRGAALQCAWREEEREHEGRKASEED
jgi:hypothetical protein